MMKSLLFLLSMSTSMALIDASHLTSVPRVFSICSGTRKMGRCTSRSLDHIGTWLRSAGICRFNRQRGWPSGYPYRNAFPRHTGFSWQIRSHARQLPLPAPPLQPLSLHTPRLSAIAQHSSSHGRAGQPGALHRVPALFPSRFHGLTCNQGRLSPRSLSTTSISHPSIAPQTTGPQTVVLCSARRGTSPEATRAH